MKVGSKVRVVNPNYTPEFRAKVGEIVGIKKIYRPPKYEVYYQDARNDMLFYESELEEIVQDAIGGYRAARGVAPRPPGSPLPEETIRQGRGG